MPSREPTTGGALHDNAIGVTLAAVVAQCVHDIDITNPYKEARENHATAEGIENAW